MVYLQKWIINLFSFKSQDIEEDKIQLKSTTSASIPNMYGSDSPVVIDNKAIHIRDVYFYQEFHFSPLK